MSDWLRQRFRPLRRSVTLCMPNDQQEADHVLQVYDRQNGRYYVVADIVLENGEFLENVIFHGDSNIAVARSLSQDRIPCRWYGCEIRHQLVVKDCSAGSDAPTEASAETRSQFRRKYTG